MNQLRTPYKLHCIEPNGESSNRPVRNVIVGDGEPLIIAGPCSVENEEQIVSIATAVKVAGATVLRGGAFGPSKSLKSVQGMGMKGLKLLDLAKQETGLPIVTEVMASSDVDTVARYSDMLQVGAWHMQNFNLLDAVAKTGRRSRPVGAWAKTPLKTPPHDLIRTRVFPYRPGKSEPLRSYPLHGGPCEERS